jgi:prepilin-type N-terminal cleavage/methylation domain-containing protein
MRNNMNKKGFTLTEVMVALGIMSALMIVILNAEKGAIKSTTDLESSSDVNSMIQTLTSQLSVPDNCKKNFEGFTVTRSGITSIVKKVKTNDFVNIITAGENFGRNLKINSIETVAGTIANQMLLKINYTPFQKQAQTASISLNVFELNGNISSCFTDLSGMIKSAIENACKGTGARFIPGTGTGLGSCEHDIEVRDANGAVVPPPIAGSFMCPAGQFLQAIETSSARAMVFKCNTVATTTCGPWQYLEGLDVNGTEICKDIRSFFSTGSGFMVLENGGTVTYKTINIAACPSGKIMQRIDAGGIPFCVDPRVSYTCPTNMYVKSIDSSGNPVCSYSTNSSVCGGGLYITSISPTGDVTCSTGTLPSSCSSTQVITGIDASGTLICGAMP